MRVLCRHWHWASVAHFHYFFSDFHFFLILSSSCETRTSSASYGTFMYYWTPMKLLFYWFYVATFQQQSRNNFLFSAQNHQSSTVSWSCWVTEKVCYSQIYFDLEETAIKYNRNVDFSISEQNFKKFPKGLMLNLHQEICKITLSSYLFKNYAFCNFFFFYLT